MCDEWGRVGKCAVAQHLEVEVATSRAAGCANETDHLSTDDTLTWGYQDPALMAIAGHHPVAVVDNGDVAVATVRPPGTDHRAVSGSVDRGALWRSQIQTLVEVRVAKVG